MQVPSLGATAQGLQCLNGDPKSDDFVKQLAAIEKNLEGNANPSPLRSFVEAKKKKELKGPTADLSKTKIIPKKLSTTTSNCPPGSEIGSFLPTERNQTDLAKIAGSARIKSIKRKCIEAALRRSNDSSGKGYFCEEGKSGGSPKSVGPPGPKGPCMTADIAEYITWLVNQAVQCLSTPEKPIDPLLFLKKLNAESGFSFFQVRETNGIIQGVGACQLTTIGIRDVNERGKKRVIESLQKSDKKSCQIFKEPLKNLPEQSKEFCSLIDMNQGLARSLIYGIGLTHIHRELDLAPVRRHPKLKKLDSDVLEHRLSLASTLAYGADGPKMAMNFLTGLDIKILKNPTKFQNELNKTPYFSAINKSFDELKALVEPISIKKASECLE